MSGIKDKSPGVLPWDSENLEKVPSVKGIYVFRNLPTKNGIIYIMYTDDLKNSLKEHWVSHDLPEVSWFDWYQVDSKETGNDILKKWLDLFNPKFNLS